METNTNDTPVGTVTTDDGVIAAGAASAETSQGNGDDSPFPPAAVAAVAARVEHNACQVCNCKGLSSMEAVILSPCHCVLCKECLIHHLVVRKSGDVAAAVTCPNCLTAVESHFLKRRVTDTTASSEPKVQGVEYNYKTEQTQVLDRGLFEFKEGNVAAPDVVAVAVVATEEAKEDEEVINAVAVQASLPAVAKKKAAKAASPAKKKKPGPKKGAAKKKATPKNIPKAASKKRKAAGDSDSDDDDDTPIASLAKKRKVSLRAKKEPDENKFQKQFEENFAKLKEYKEQHGSCKVPASHDKNLHRWLLALRRKKIKLTEERTKLLEEIGFDMNAAIISSAGKSNLFATRYATLIAFKDKHGHCDLTAENAVGPEEEDVARWLKRIQAGAAFVKETAKQEKLEALGVDLSRKYKHTSFDERIESLRRYKTEHGDLLVPSKWAHDKNLGQWCRNVREGKVKLSKDQRRMLNQLGFSFETRVNMLDRLWKERFQRLQQWLQQDPVNHTPRNIPDKQVSEWSHTQRKLLAKGELRPHRLRQLEEIGFFVHEKNSRGSLGGGAPPQLQQRVPEQQPPQQPLQHSVAAVLQQHQPPVPEIVHHPGLIVGNVAEAMEQVHHHQQEQDNQWKEHLWHRALASQHAQL